MADDKRDTGTQDQGGNQAGKDRQRRNRKSGGGGMSGGGGGMESPDRGRTGGQDERERQE